MRAAAQTAKDRRRRPEKYQKTSRGVAVEIDSFVPCLKRVSDGKIVDTEVAKIDRKDAASYRESGGWYINWDEVPKGSTIYKLTVAGEDIAQGLIATVDDPKNSAVYMHWGVAAPANQGNRVGTEGKAYEGVGGHLFSIAARESVERGYGGFMFGKAANKRLLEHYIEKIGAVPTYNGYGFYIDEQASAELLDKYNWTER